MLGFLFIHAATLYRLHDILPGGMFTCHENLSKQEVKLLSMPNKLLLHFLFFFFVFFVRVQLKGCFADPDAFAQIYPHVQSRRFVNVSL